MNATRMPTPFMLGKAAASPLDRHIHSLIDQAFKLKLRSVGGLRYENQLDHTAPPLTFIFINHCIVGQGVERLPLKRSSGCDRCRPDMGLNRGCEYTRRCSCLDYAAVNEQALNHDSSDDHHGLRGSETGRMRIDSASYSLYAHRKVTGTIFDMQGLPKRFPYIASDPPRLQKFYLISRNAIYECNSMCNCGPGCKNRVVQKGRQIELTIFKTADRGWGLRSTQDILKGQFVDTYRGEIITSAEADRREEDQTDGEALSYMFDLDKFVGIDPEIRQEDCYVLDGQHMGGPMRFVNHSCEPNLRQFTVSYNKHDRKVYEVAFFAIVHIEAGTELTFDYRDFDEVDEDIAVAQREAALADPANAGKARCKCGSRKCRGFLWM